MNIEYVEGKDINELLKNIDINYKECKKYDIYIEEDNIDEEKEEFNDLKIKDKKNRVKKFKTNNFKNQCTHESEIKNGIDNIKNIIFQKKFTNDNKKYENVKKGNNRNILTNLNCRRKRILESSDESDQNEFIHPLKKIVDYVNERKIQRKIQRKR